MLDEMQESGYAGTELGDWGVMPTDPAKLRSELVARNLSLMAAFVPVALIHPEKHAKGEEIALRTAGLLAATAGEQCFIVLSDDNAADPNRTLKAGRIQPEDGLTPDQWKTAADGANRIAQAVNRETGLRTVFHHHAAGYVETPAETATFLELTDPQVVGLCFDTGHYAFAGGDPLQGLREHRSRVWHVHFKDCEPNVAGRSRREGWEYFKTVGNGVYCELGKGMVDFPAIVAELRATDYDGWIVVEQDVLPGMGSPLESAKRNREYLQSIGL
ncbi:MAG: TIM barrel protein [Chloroflexi bacterium]|nr:xylose isomerase [Chloroflexota bacterium]NOG62849.1 TIM barrel protein [Chloroflexota bacterium]